MPETLSQALTIALGRAFSWKPSAIGVAGPWSLTGDTPPGLTLSTTTGELSGTPTAAGTSAFVIANEGGDVTATLTLTVGAEAGDDEDVSIPLDFDLDTGLVTRPGEQEPATLYLGKIGDKLPVAIGFVRQGALKKITPTKLRIGVKEFEPERLIGLNGEGTDFDLVETAAGFRARTVIEFFRTDLGRLGQEYEGDFVSGTEVPAEIELSTLATLSTLPPEDTPAPELVSASVSVTNPSSVMTDTDNLVFSLPGGAGTYRFSAVFAHATYGVEFEWVDTVVDDGSGNFSVPNPTYLPRGKIRVDHGGGEWIEFHCRRVSVTAGSSQITLVMTSWYIGWKASWPTISGTLQVTAEMIAAPPTGVSPYDVDPGSFRRSSQSFRLRIERDLQPETE